MIKSTTASSKKGNLRGSGSSSSTTPPEDYKPDDTKVSSSKSKSKSKSKGFLSPEKAVILEEDENKPDTTPLKPVNQIVEI